MDELNLSDEPIAVGRTSEVYALGEDRVVKLLRDGFPKDMIDLEAAKTAAAHEAGVPAPAVHGTVEVDGRPGIIVDRVDGDLLIDELVFEPMRIRSWARVFADTHVSTLSVSSQDLPDVRDVLEGKIRAADITEGQRSAALTVLAAAPQDDAVLHGDFHPANIVVTADGPVLIDWMDGARGHPGADIARTLWLLSPATLPPDRPNRRLFLMLQGMFRRPYLKQCSRQLGIDRRVIDAWRLPVVAARLAEGVEWEEAALRTELDRLTDR
jgi:aminoglycoside phosphotransferase (APT) family kinase protein